MAVASAPGPSSNQAPIVCDGSVLGAGCIVRAGAVVKQRSRFSPSTDIDGFPAVEVGRLSEPPDIPSWALRRPDLPEMTPSRTGPVTTVRHVAHAVGSTGSTVPAYRVDLRVGPHELVADEPTAAGGGAVGPSPFRSTSLPTTASAWRTSPSGPP